MDKLPNCTVCNSSYTYIDREVYVCPECGYEWSDNDNQTTIIYDANNNILNDGDTVILIKDLKVKGSSNSLKKGTKVKNIKLRPDEEHNIDCKIEGFGAMELKSEFVKKAA